MTWQELIGGAVILMIGTAFKIVWEKVKGKADKEMCVVLHEEIKKEFTRGAEKFDKFEKKLDRQGETLTDFSTNLALMAQSMKTMAQNGQKN